MALFVAGAHEVLEGTCQRVRQVLREIDRLDRHCRLQVVVRVIDEIRLRLLGDLRRFVIDVGLLDLFGCFRLSFVLLRSAGIEVFEILLEVFVRLLETLIERHELFVGLRKHPQLAGRRELAQRGHRDA